MTLLSRWQDLPKQSLDMVKNMSGGHEYNNLMRDITVPEHNQLVQHVDAGQLNIPP